MRILALDVGSKTVGVAVSDPLGMFAQPVETLQRSGRKADVARLHALVSERGAERVVVGLPIRTDGEEGDSAAEARRMAVALQESLGEKIPVVMEDERFTTAQAERVLIQGRVRRKNRKKYIDQLAAVLILQSYLDQQP